MCNMPVKLHIPHFPVNIEYFYLPDIFLSHHSLITPPLISHIPIKRQRINPIFILVFIFDDRRKLYSCIYFKFKCKIINVILNQSNFFIRHFQWITRQLSYQSIWKKAVSRLFSGCSHDTTTVCSLELYSYFYYFRCFQSGYGQFSFYSGYGVIFSQDIICAYGICVIGSVSISVRPSLFPFGRLCISFPYFWWQRTALAGITFFLLQYIYG